MKNRAGSGITELGFLQLGYVFRHPLETRTMVFGGPKFGSPPSLTLQGYLRLRQLRSRIRVCNVERIGTCSQLLRLQLYMCRVREAGRFLLLVFRV